MAMTDLPVELIYPILDFLHAEDILFTFRLVCRQFYRIVENYDRLKIQLRRKTSKAVIQRLCRVVRPKNVTSLLFEKSHLNPDNIECFFQSAAIDQFNRLRSLTLNNIETDDLERFVTPLSTLTSVTVNMKANSGRRYYIVVPCLTRIINLENIRQLTLDINSRVINAISWPKNCTIEQLTLRCCSYRQFCNIFDRSSNLKDFILDDNFTGDLDSSIRPKTCRSLTSLTLKEIDLPMEELEFFLSLHPRLISLTLTTEQNVSWNTFQHFSRWEKFLQLTLPLLKNFNFSMSNQCDQFENVESILSPLCTSFWLETKRWFFTCQYTEGSSFKTIQLYSSAYSTAQFPDSLNRANLSYAITTMSSGNQPNRSRMWSARVNLDWMINAIITNTFKVPDQHYFRHVTCLAFDVDANPEWWPVDALQEISTWIDLSQLHEIWILETSPYELQFDDIKFLLAQAPQVRTFGLAYNDLFARIRQTLFTTDRRLPFVQRKINEARAATLKSVCDDMAKSIAGHEFTTVLPQQGLSQEKLIQKLEEYRKLEKFSFQSGKISGCVYKLAKPDMTEIYNKVFALFGETNPLHVDVFPDIRTMEAETVRCVATMFHGDTDVCGTMTSGGTESILMACKTYRDLAIAKGISKPEM
ncbi:unnamed protein product [Rotaria socialis]|uniref:F-box domain-containing protein n=1 Tax=Rotaria socialis TaxID=392032 RepID=A0A818W4L9_9BILA|nr:unnamed protein product [Rotaria socialis]